MIFVSLHLFTISLAMAAVTVNILQVCPIDCLFEVLRCLNTRELLVFTGVSQTAKDSIQGYNKLPITRRTQFEYHLHTAFGLIHKNFLDGKFLQLVKIPTTLKRSVYACTFHIDKKFDYQKYDSNWIKEFKQLNTISFEYSLSNTVSEISNATIWLNQIVPFTCAQKIQLWSRCWFQPISGYFTPKMKELVINFENNGPIKTTLPVPSNYVPHVSEVDIILNFRQLVRDIQYWMNYYLYMFSSYFSKIRKLDLRDLKVLDRCVFLIPCEAVSVNSVAMGWDFILDDSNWPGKKKVWCILDHSISHSLEASSSSISHMYLQTHCYGPNSEVSSIAVYNKWVVFLTQVLEIKHKTIPNIQYIDLVIDYSVTCNPSPKNISTHIKISGVELHVTCGYCAKSNFHI